MSGRSPLKTQPQRRASLPSLSDERGGVELAPARPKLKKPRLFKVVLINDDYTPMDFVVHALQRFFHLDRDRAARLTFEIHTKGRGVCGVFSREIAETKVASVNDYSRTQKHPLLCVMEPNEPC